MSTALKHAIQSLVIGLSLPYFLQFAVAAAQAQNPPAQNPPSELNIVVVQGEGTINQVRQAVATEPVIRAEDENHKPIAGATVVFTLPTEGATGHFGNGGKILTVTTNAQGRATAEGLKVNEYPGKLVLHINVSYRGLSARTNITQFDEGPPVAQKAGKSGGHGKLVVILAVVGAAAGGGAYFATHRNSSSSTTGTTPPTVVSIGLTPGTPTITGPH